MMSTNRRLEIARGKMKVDEMEDRLSNLPNEILIKILSCLRTKESVSTGILSTRWKSLWLSVSTFGFFEIDFELENRSSDDRSVEERFSDFVNEVLVAHKLPLLERIHIATSLADPDDMISWIRAALERNISDLDIEYGELRSGDGQYYDEPSCDLPPDLFSYNKLVKLKLHENITLSFSESSSSFPSLKVLDLNNILYEDDDTLPNLLSACPVLEDLRIGRSRWDYMGTLDITSHSLKKVKVYTDFEDIDDKIRCQDNLETIIDASSLENLDIYCFATKDYVVKDLSSLVVAKLDFCEPNSSLADILKNYIKCLLEFLTGIPNVKFLTLHSSIFKTLMYTDSWNLPLFHNLTRLNIYLTFYDDYESTKCSDWKLMLEFLKSSPVLEILQFRRRFDFFPQCVKASDWDVPDCLVSHLKAIIIDFYYCEAHDDMAMVNYFFKNAKVLEKMIIVCSQKDREKLFNDISSVISENPKGSVKPEEWGVIVSFI